MNFGIAIEIDLEADGRSALIQRVSDSLAEYLKDKDYGGDIENLHIGLICQRPVLGFESFAKKRKPKYVSNQSVELLDGSVRAIRNTFSYDIKLIPESYELFVTGSEIEALTLLLDTLITSLSNFDALPKKVKNFNVEMFKLEMTSHLHGSVGSDSNGTY